MKRGQIAMLKDGSKITAVRKLKAGYWLFKYVDKYGVTDTITIHESVFNFYDFKDGDNQ